MRGFIKRRDSSFPFQHWKAFPSEAIVLVKNAYGDRRIDQAKNLWWGYEIECGELGEGVIIEARRLDRPRASPNVNGDEA